MMRHYPLDKLREELAEIQKEYDKLMKKYKGDGLTNEEMQRLDMLELDMRAIYHEIRKRTR